MFGLANTVPAAAFPVKSEQAARGLRPRNRQIEHAPVTLARLRAVRDQSRACSDVAGFDYGGTWPHVFDDGDRHLTLVGALVTGNFFHTLGTRPVLGRLLEPTDDVFGAAPVLVLSDVAWHRDFLADREVIGRRVTL
jgi:hypothetical protein